MRYRNKNPVDQGYSWLLLTACFVSYLITFGILKSFGILYSELLDFYQSNAGAITTVGIVSTSLHTILCPIAVNLCTHYSFRWTMFAAGTTIGLGFFLSSFVTRIEVLFITYSFICGVGFAFSVGSCVTVVNFYFEKRRGLANGILVSASGIGNFIFPHLYTFLFSTYGLRGAFMIIGGVALQGCIGATFVRQPVLRDDSQHAMQSNPATLDHDFTHSSQNTKNIFKSCFEFFKNCFVIDLRLFKDMSFLLYCWGFVFTVFSYTSNFFMLAAHIENTGYTKEIAAFVMSVLGLSEFIGRILVGLFVDLKIIAPKYIYIIFMAISGTAEVCVPFFHSYAWYCTYAGIVGVFPGSFFTLQPLLLMDILGRNKFPAGFGLVTVVTAIFFLIVQPALGWLKDYTGSWNISWVIAGTFMLLSAALVAFDSCLRQKQKDREETAKRKSSFDANIQINVNDSVRPTQGYGMLALSEEVEEGEAHMLRMPAEHLRK